MPTCQAKLHNSTQEPLPYISLLRHCLGCCPTVWESGWRAQKASWVPVLDTGWRSLVRKAEVLRVDAAPWSRQQGRACPSAVSTQVRFTHLLHYEPRWLPGSGLGEDLATKAPVWCGLHFPFTLSGEFRHENHSCHRCLTPENLYPDKARQGEDVAFRYHLDSQGRA